MKPFTRLLLAVVASMGFLLGSTSQTLAHYVYQEGMVYIKPGANCTYGRSETSHGNGGGYSKVATGSKTFNSRFGDCTADLTRPAGFIKMKAEIFKQQSNGSYAICAWTDWQYNTSLDWYAWMDTYYNTPCGPGNYNTLGHHYVNLNGPWEGNTLPLS